MKCKHLLIDGCIHGGRNLWEEMLSNYHVSISYNQMPLFLLQCTFRNEKTRRVRDEKVECQGSGELRCKTGGQLVGALTHAYKLQFSISTRWFNITNINLSITNITNINLIVIHQKEILALPISRLHPKLTKLRNRHSEFPQYRFFMFWLSP